MNKIEESSLFFFHRHIRREIGSSRKKNINVRRRFGNEILGIGHQYSYPQTHEAASNTGSSVKLTHAHASILATGGAQCVIPFTVAKDEEYFVFCWNEFKIWDTENDLWKRRFGFWVYDPFWRLISEEFILKCRKDDWLSNWCESQEDHSMPSRVCLCVALSHTHTHSYPSPSRSGWIPQSNTWILGAAGISHSSAHTPPLRHPINRRDWSCTPVSAPHRRPVILSLIFFLVSILWTLDMLCVRAWRNGFATARQIISDIEPRTDHLHYQEAWLRCGLSA